MFKFHVAEDASSTNNAPFILTHHMLMFIAAMAVAAIVVTALYLASNRSKGPLASSNAGIGIVFEYS